MKTFYQNRLEKVLRIIKKLNPEKIILFGSAISGKIKKDSDIDLCVIAKGDRFEIKKEIWEGLWKSNYDWEIEPDLHVFDPKTYKKWLLGGDPFLEEIEKGKVIYAKS